jgi:hypothetical protein
VHGWIEPFFERAQPALAPGHVWSGEPIALPPSHGLKIGKIDPKDDSKLGFEVVGRGDDSFAHPPIHSLGLSSEEALVLARATRGRAVVVLGGTTTSQLLGGDGESDASPVVVVPLHQAERYDETTRRRVANYEFANAFYLPVSERPRFEESVARLDHVQPVPRADLTAHRGVKLSADALDALVEWFVAYTTNRLLDGSLILEYRRQQLAGG